MEDCDIHRLSQSLLKSSTSISLAKSHLMPAKNFIKLFKSWTDNNMLDIKRLRLKALTLFALVGMLGPRILLLKRSNLMHSHCQQTSFFSTDHIVFNDNGSMSITLYGFKNDTSRSGFEVTVPDIEDEQCHPVRTLRMYIDITRIYRPCVTLLVFLTLKAPYKMLEASSIANILVESIVLANLPR